MKRPLGILLLCILILASLFVGIACWTVIVPRLIAAPGPKTMLEWLAVIVLSALPLSVPPAMVGLWQGAGWASGAVAVWGALWVSELTLTLIAAGALAGIGGPEWFVPWLAMIAAVLAVAALVRYVRRAGGGRKPPGERP
jgi:hypothetical protein